LQGKGRAEAIEESVPIQFLTWKYFPLAAVAAGIFGLAHGLAAQ